MEHKNITQGFELAKEVYASSGLDVQQAIDRANAIAVSMHCWQGDDVIGFDGSDSLSGGIQTTGTYPGRARTPDELRADIDLARSLIPGKTKLNLHACLCGKERQACGSGRLHRRGVLRMAGLGEGREHRTGL